LPPEKTYTYYPGCSLKRFGTAFETSALASARALGLGLEEMADWNCCGTVHGLADDALIHKVAPLRVLLRARDQGSDSIVTLCSICYNTLKRTNLLMREDEAARKRLNLFLDDYEDYDGSLRVLHFLEVLRDDVGFERVREAVTAPLKGLKASPYYGCMLVRPQALGLDDLERPRVLSDLLEAIGAEPRESPYATECCGSYHAVGDPELSAAYTGRILKAARGRDAAMLVASCPLCVYNLDARQAEARAEDPSVPVLPVLYFTQLLGLALGVPAEDLGFEDLAVDPRPALEAAGLEIGKTATEPA
jgi:heterodisulfide reductase subunit B